MASSISRQKGAIGVGILLAVLLAVVILSWISMNRVKQQIREIHEQNFQQLVEKSAAQKAVLYKALIDWMQTRGESLLYAGCPLYDNCDVGIKKAILPAMATDLRDYGGMANGFARDINNPASDRFYSLLGRPYKAAVVKEGVPGKPGLFQYTLMLWEH